MRKLDKNTIVKKISETLTNLKIFLSSYIPVDKEFEDNEKTEKPYKLSEWIDQWIEYLKFENVFTPTKLKRYKRGEVVYVNLGFNVGCETGGAHYAIVINSNDSIKRPILTVLPMTSKKEHTELDKLGADRIFIGDELKSKLVEKYKKESERIKSEISKINIENKNGEDIKMMRKLVYDVEDLKTFANRINGMNKGSIVNIGQIRTISKMRVIRPKNHKDLFSDIIISNKTMDIISERMKNLLFKKIVDKKE